MRSILNKILFPVAVLISPALALAGPVNINKADADTLAEELTGIGPALASAIVRDREENGPYESADELMRVRGIGPRVLEQNDQFILLEDPE